MTLFFTRAKLRLKKIFNRSVYRFCYFRYTLFDKNIYSGVTRMKRSIYISKDILRVGSSNKKLKYRRLIFFVDFNYQNQITYIYYIDLVEAIIGHHNFLLR